MTDLSLMEMGLKAQRLSRSLKDYVEVVLNVAGNTWEGECEVVYTLVPAFSGRDDEPGHSEHIEIHSATLISGEIRIDITGLVGKYDELHEAIQQQILGE